MDDVGVAATVGVMEGGARGMGVVNVAAVREPGSMGTFTVFRTSKAAFCR